MSDPVVEAQGLVKRYGKVKAVDGVTLGIARGEVFGLLGPNGAGKTTTLLMLMGLTERSAGTARVLGLDPARAPLAVKRRVGYLPDSVGFYDHLSARANLRYSGRLAGVPRGELDGRIEAALARVGLAGVAAQRVKTFSRGMRQRLGLAEIMLKGPEIAMLDEPTAGLDPTATHEFLGIIRSLKAEGMTVLLSSHLLDQVQSVCDRVALFNRGRIALEGSVRELGQRILGAGYRIRLEARGGALDDVLAQLPGIVRVSRDGEDRYRIEAERDLRAELSRAVIEAGAALLAMSLAEPSLDEVYRAYFDGARDAA